MIEQFEQREKEVFGILDRLKGFKGIALLGGYALNSYVEFPRFSIDCDLIAYDGKNIATILRAENYKRIKDGKGFLRFEKKTGKVRVEMDVLIGSLMDRQSGITFELSDILRDSAIRDLSAKSNPKLKVKFRTASPEMLFVLKFASLRDQDIRDIFMLSTHELDRGKIKSLIKKYFSGELLEGRIKKLEELVENKNFIDSLQGVYGKLPEEFMNRNKKRLLSFVTR